MRYTTTTGQWRSKGHAAAGVAAVEFALLIVILLMLVAGIIEFGRTFWYYDALAKGTRAAARFLSDSRASATVALDSSLQQQARELVSATASAARVPDFSSTDVTVQCDPTCVAPRYVTVQVNAYPVTIGGWIPFVTPTGGANWARTLSPSTTMRYMR